MRLCRTRIEYAMQNGKMGYHWPLITGCAHTQAECPIADRCWARTMAHRFQRDFTPQLHPELLEATMPRKPSRILVSFTGDMFGNWWEWELGRNRVKMEAWQDLVDKTLVKVRENPQHSFLFLTKAPQNLARFNPWPDNAWVGMSLTGAETPRRQENMFWAMNEVKGGHLWLSYEPMLGPLLNDAFALEWIVVGAQGGPGAVRPQQEWVNGVVDKAERWKVPLWEKRNLPDFPGMTCSRELPDGMVR